MSQSRSRDFIVLRQMGKGTFLEERSQSRSRDFIVLRKAADTAAKKSKPSQSRSRDFIVLRKVVQ